MTVRAILFATAMTLVAGTSAALAQAPSPKLRGTIESVAGNVVTVKTLDGRDVAVTLAPDAKVLGVKPFSVDQIKPGSYIGSAALPQPDGTLKALEVLVFPPAMAGSGEGHYPWDLAPGSSMTNATVGDVMTAGGRMMTVHYKGGEQRITVGDGVPVMTMEPSDRSLLTPGTHVFMAPMPGADGTMMAGFVAAGENGAVPPM